MCIKSHVTFCFNIQKWIEFLCKDGFSLFLLKRDFSLYLLHICSHISIFHKYEDGERFCFLMFIFSIIDRFLFRVRRFLLRVRRFLFRFGDFCCVVSIDFWSNLHLLIYFPRINWIIKFKAMSVNELLSLNYLSSASIISC